MADNQLLQFVRPMPETYDIQEPEGLPFLRALAAGAADPYGATGWAVDKIGLGDWFGRRMQEMRAEHPVAAGVGTGITTGLALNPAMGAYAAARNVGLGYAGHIPWTTYVGGIGPAAPGLSGMIGGSVAKTMDKLGAFRSAPRAQASYPPDEAY
jgi:hypothetical protein